MDYEYVALTWHMEPKTADNLFMNNYHRLCEAGWEISLDAPFEAECVGGACIMRRPKDEPRCEAPRNWTRCENCGYVDRPRMLAEKDVLGHLAPPELKKVARMWSTEELVEIVSKVLDQPTNLRDRLERRNGDLQERLSERQETICAQTLHIAELQAAIDKVETIARNPSLDYTESHMAVVRHLYPLATKKEA